MAVGDERQTEPVAADWAGVLPTTAALPRASIEVSCDEALVRRATRSAVVLTVVGPRSLWAVVVAVVASACVLAQFDAIPWWVFGVVTAGYYALQVVATSARLTRAFRQMLPLGTTVRSWYAAPEVLVMETGNGRTEFRAGSLASARRRGSVLQLRLRRNRRRGFVLGAMLTDADLGFLLTPAPPGHHPLPAMNGADLPIVVVVTAPVRQAIRRAVLVFLWRRPSVVVLLALSALLLAAAVLLDPAYAAAPAFILGMLGLSTVVTLRGIQRTYPPGLVIQAAITDGGLRLRTGDDLEDTFVLRSARRCVVGRRVVRIDRQQGQPSIFLPRDLFPPAELARLQRAIGA